VDNIGIGDAASVAGNLDQSVTVASGPTLSAVVSFDGTDGSNPQAGLILDAAGDLLGTTANGGANTVGTVFEIANTATGYASTPTDLASFDSGTGYSLQGGLLANAAGDLFGTTQTGGANGDGTIFEIVSTGTGYASAPTVLASFNGTTGGGPYAGLISDAAGDLFGTTEGGGLGYGTVFELPYSGGTYASTPTMLAGLNGTNGAYPYAGLVADSAGDLFGTSVDNGADNEGTVFEIAKTANGYASAPTVLVNFNAADGASAYGTMIINAAGDLFGTTEGGGPNGDGTVFELVKTGGSYASTPITLATFNGSDGAFPTDGVIMDADGDLFGTALYGGTDNWGTVFEIANIAGTYASTPITLASFTGFNGQFPHAGLVADAEGDLFGTANTGGSNNSGTVFELTDSGFQVAGVGWLIDAAGNFDDPTRWAGGAVPGAGSDALIDFADQPQVLHNAGSDSVHSLTNTAGDFVMSGGSLTADALANDSAMSWTGGSLILNSGTGGAATLSNAAGAGLTIAASGQRLTAIGAGTASVINAGKITVDNAPGEADIDVAFVNTGQVLVNRGTLSLNGGGSSNASLLATGSAGVLQFGAPAGQTSGGSFILTGGVYGGVETVISGGTLNAAAASGVYFNDLRLAASGALLLGAANAQTNAAFVQGPTAWANALGAPYLAGSGTFTVYGGASLAAGVESGSGLTRLFGTGAIGGSFAVDGGRTVENDGFLTWSSGNITLGAGDAAAVTQSGTLGNVSGAILYVTAGGGRLGVGTGGSGVLENAGVAAFYAGAGEVDIDAAVANTGYLQALSGTLSLNGGGSSDAGHLIVAAGATLQFGARAGTAGGATFTLTGGELTAGSVVISGSTVDASASSGVSMGTLQLAGSGALLLGAVNGQTSGGFSQGPDGWENASGVPFLSGSGTFTVFGGASLSGGVQSGSGLTRLFGTSVIGGAGLSLDGGRTLENDGWLNWSSGNITLGAGDAAVLMQAGTLSNVAGAVLFVTASGDRIADAAGGVLNNAGVMAVYAGGGEVDVDATLANTGYIQALSGTLSLNGGGSSDAGHLIEGSGAVLQFGTSESGTGGTFTVTGGFYSTPVTQVTGGTLDLSAASGVSFGTAVSVSGSGELALGSLFVEANAMSVAGGGAVRSNGIVEVNGPAVLGSGVLSGTGTMVLEAGGSIGGALQLDGGLTLQNSGVLDWTGGSIALGSGDSAAAVQAGVLNNVAGAVFDIETNGTISAPGTATMFNAGTILADGLGLSMVNAGVDNTGTVIVSAGTLAFGQAVGGAGAFMLDGTATLDLVAGAGAGSTMQFVYPGGTLETQALGSFASVISGFAAGDVIDAAGVGFVTGTTAVGFVGGTLTVSDGAAQAGFTLAGTYDAGSFHVIGSDGHGGTEVGYG
jgi:uncharacterized repeat protein (TIGR03803 family)